MTTLRNKRKLAAVAREAQAKHPRNSQSRNTSVPRKNGEYITQVSAEIEGKVIKKLPLEFSRTQSCNLVALSKLNEFLLNPQVRRRSGTVPGTFRNTDMDNQEPNENCPRDRRHPEVGASFYQSHQAID